MITRYRISLDNVQLDSLDENIVIQDIGYSPISFRDKNRTSADLDGFDIDETYYESQTVTVSLQLRIYDTAKRNKAVQKINEWAKGMKTLQVNDREGQYLYAVKCQQFASVSSVRNWLDPLTLVFTTGYVPFWISSSAKTVTVVGKNNKGTLKMEGNADKPSLVSVTVTAEEAVSSIQLTVGDTMLKLTGLSVAIGQQIIIDYIRNRYLRVRANGASVLNKLDKSSSDRLMAKCGENVTVNVVASGRVSAVFSGRGLWL